MAQLCELTPLSLPRPLLQACQEPERVKEGMGGSYLCFNEAGGRVAILKPCDEEPLAPNNPKGYVGRNLGDPGWRATVRVGEVCVRRRVRMGGHSPATAGWAITAADTPLP